MIDTATWPEDVMRQSLTAAMDVYLAAAAALERWSYDQLEVEVLRMDLDHARRRLMERMEAVEKQVRGKLQSACSPRGSDDGACGRDQCRRSAAGAELPGLHRRTDPPKRSRRIMVAVDDSDPGRWAVSVAAALATPLGAELVLLHVISPAAMLSPETAFDAEDIRGGQLRKSDELLAAAHALVGSGTAVERVTREGEAAQEIVEAASEWEADLVVMGTRSRGRLASFLLGSTAEAVIRRANCPVLTVAHDPVERAAASQAPHEEGRGQLTTIA
jgi:nucleotide-binding universal stress UspA family protein